MTRSVRLYTATQFEEVKTLVDPMAERSGFPPAERDQLAAFQADLRQTIREDRRRATPLILKAVGQVNVSAASTE